MNRSLIASAILSLCVIACSAPKNENLKTDSLYRVTKTGQPMPIDGNWDKPQWQAIEAIDIKHLMGDTPVFLPTVKAKMLYDTGNLYVIFRVEDRYVRSVTTVTNGPVWEDSCVELFFSPDTSAPDQYFNLEINCGGAALMKYNIIPRKEYKSLDPEDIEMIEIAHSLPDQIIKEIIDPVTWTLEYRLPFELLEKYAPVIRPGSGVTWRANFYKIADKTSNPHYLTWSLIDQDEPDFHLPGFFGKLIFQ